MAKSLAEIQQKFNTMGVGQLPADALAAALYRDGTLDRMTTERGSRSTPEASARYLQSMFQVDFSLRARILDIRHMHGADGRVKRIHNKIKRDAVKGGIFLKNEMSTRLQRRFNDFVRRMNFEKRGKLESDALGMVMEGNVPMQWVLGEDRRLHAGIRMPTETLSPQVTPTGTFKDPRQAFVQRDLLTGQMVASFALWQMSWVRLDPLNWDDAGSLGMPLLDAARGAWKKLTTTEEDMVIRRKTRAQQRKVHLLKNATPEFADAYEAKINADMYDQNSDYIVRGDGDVKAISGDENLGQIEDVVHLMDTFFSTMGNKAIFGYTKGLSRDILEDLTRIYYEDLDSIQDEIAGLYNLAWRLDQLLAGINPDNSDGVVAFRERRTETANQAADRALKYQAMGMSTETVFETAGIDAAKERERLDGQMNDPYPDPNAIGLPESSANNPSVSITPSNAPKGDSATTISTRN